MGASMDGQAEPGRGTATEMDEALGSLEAELASFREPILPALSVSGESPVRESAEADASEVDEPPHDAHFLIAAYRAC